MNMSKLTEILHNSKLTAETIKDNLLHPVLKTTDYQPREIFDELKEISDIYFTSGRDARMIGLSGLRGTGKTTLLWQTANYIFHNYTKNIYFFHIGNLQKYDIGIKEIQEVIEKDLANGRLSSYKENIVLLFDEVHEDKNWSRDLKILYDLFPAVFVIATGSSALLLQSTADLVTRMLILHVFPLNFSEYLEITNSNIKQKHKLKLDLKEILFYSETAENLHKQFLKIQPEIDDYFSQINNLQDEIFNYISYKNITRFAFFESKSRINMLIADLIRRVIYEDIPKISKNINNQFSEKILQRISASDEINLQTLSQTIGISQKEILENLNILVKAELLNVLYPFGGIDTKLNKFHKYFFMSPSIRKVLLNPFISTKHENTIFAKLLEDTVVLYLKRIFRDTDIFSFASVKGQKNPDIIIETINNPILIEIGINKNTGKQIYKSNIKYKYAIIINAKSENIELRENIVIIPLKYFLFL